MVRSDPRKSFIKSATGDVYTDDIDTDDATDNDTGDDNNDEAMRLC